MQKIIRQDTEYQNINAPSSKAKYKGDLRAAWTVINPIIGKPQNCEMGPSKVMVTAPINRPLVGLKTDRNLPFTDMNNTTNVPIPIPTQKAAKIENIIGKESKPKMTTDKFCVWNRSAQLESMIESPNPKANDCRVVFRLLDSLIGKYP